MDVSSTPSEGSAHAKPRENPKLAVVQPEKVREIEHLLETLTAIESLSDKVSERTGEDRSGDLGSGGGGVRRDDGTALSPRELAIQNIPLQAIMQKKLEKHIQREVKKLSHEARRVARIGRPGSAFTLNQLYARIRMLTALLQEILEASYEIVKRLFIRVFVDKQPIL